MRRNRLFGWMAGLTSAALAAMAAAAPVMAAVSESSPGGGNSGSGERVEETAEDEEDALGKGQETEEGAEVAGAAAPGVTTGNGQKTGAMEEENEPAAQEAGVHGEDALNKPAAQSGGAGTETTGVYEFQDTKTSGTVTVVKKWDDQSNNEERPPVDVVNINLSTQKPSRNPLGYTVTFHADAEKGLTFADGSTINEVVYNGNGQIVSGAYKGLTGGNGVMRWHTDRTYQTKIEINENGELNTRLTRDVDVWPKEVTFEVKGYFNDYDIKNKFKQAIPDTVISIVFTDEVMPADAVLINVDADDDGGVVAWTEEDGTIMKVSTQVKGEKVQAAKNSEMMFYDKPKIQTIDFTNLDTTNVTNMSYMFCYCSGLTSLNVSSFDTANVTSMYGMFAQCDKLTSLDLSQFNTTNVTDMGNMFYSCHSLTLIDMSAFDTSNVKNMGKMFSYASSISSLDLSNFDTSQVTSMRQMFDGCASLIDLNLHGWNTENVIEMNQMFQGCKALLTIDLSSFSTKNVTKMGSLFYMPNGRFKLQTIRVGQGFVFGKSYEYGNANTIWQNSAGEQFKFGTFPSNVADTYTRIK